MKKSRYTFAIWCDKYKVKKIHDLTLNEYTEWLRQYKAWRIGNIEKV